MEDREKRSRNIGIDVLKSICAVMVVCIHSSYPGKEMLEPFTRMAVPVFFIITGYYYSVTEARKKTFEQIKKISILLAIASVLFIVGKPVMEILMSRSPLAVIEQWLTPEALISFLIFNKPPYSTHLWYLVALLWVLLIAEMTGRKIQRKKLYFLIPVLLFGNWVLGNYSLLLFDVTFPTQYSRNFLFAGLPCFLLGDYIFTHESKRQSPAMLFAVLTGGAILTQIEKYLLTSVDAYGNQDFFVGTIFMAYAAFQLSSCNLSLFHIDFIKRIGYWGGKLSAGVYIIHPIIGSIMSKIAEIIGKYIPVISILYPYFAVAVVTCVSAMIIAIFLYAKKKVTVSVGRSIG